MWPGEARSDWSFAASTRGAPDVAGSRNLYFVGCFRVAAVEWVGPAAVTVAGLTAKKGMVSSLNVH